MAKLQRTALLEVPPAVAYGVVIDVLSYPDFVPGCKSVRVLESSALGLVAEMAVAGRGLHESLVTTNRHTVDETVKMSLRDGPFERLEGEWRFTALGDLGCRIELHIDFVPKGMVARILSGFADKLANRIVDAFSQRILEQYRVRLGT